MILAYDYPLLGVMWSFIVFFIWIAWLMVLFRVLVDIFRSHDMGGFAKALWMIFVIVAPFLGVFVYLIARGNKMTEHAIEDAQKQEAAMQSYVKQAAGTSGPADQLAQLVDLHSSGALTDAEYETAKAKILAA